jgi:hypothetical protein
MKNAPGKEPGVMKFDSSNLGLCRRSVGKLGYIDNVAILHA